MREIPLPSKANLTTAEAYEYVGNRPMFEHLLTHYGLKPIWIGKGNKTVLYRVKAIELALDQLEINGGFNVTAQHSHAPAPEHNPHNS